MVPAGLNAARGAGGGGTPGSGRATDRPADGGQARVVRPVGNELLEARNVAVSFGGVHAIQGLDLSLRRLDILGLIGPNGAGKSTTVNVLSGFQKPTAGAVLLNGTDIRRWPAHRVARGGVARTFQAARLFTALSTLDNVVAAGLSLGRSARRTRQDALDLLQWCGCRGDAGLPAASLNYGDQRRAAIARALAVEPKFLLLDEPAAGLNADEAEALVELIRGIPARAGCGVLLIEHNMSVVMKTCQRILVLDGGRPIAEGTPVAIQSDPAVRRAYLGDRVTRERGGE